MILILGRLNDLNVSIRMEELRQKLAKFGKNLAKIETLEEKIEELEEDLEEKDDEIEQLQEIHGIGTI